MIDWKEIAERLAASDAGWYAPEAFDAMMRAVEEATAVELESQAAYYQRAQLDITRTLEHVEDDASEAAVALRAVCRQMAATAEQLARRARELRGES